MKRITILGVALTISASLFAGQASAATYETEVTSGVNFRSAPSASSSVYRLISKGEDIHVIEQVNRYWLKIQTRDGKVGYISANDRYTDYEPKESADKSSSAKAKNGVNFRSGARVADNIIGFIREGETVEVLEKVNRHWLKVRHDGKVGYASANYFDLKSAPVTNPEPADAKASEILATARSYLGDFKYSFGAEPWNTNYRYSDCSAFIQLVFNKKHGYDLPRTSKSQSKEGSYVSKSNLKPGDLVFFDTDENGSINHVGIYIGNGDFIHSSPINEVGISNLRSGYWEDHYKTARRVL